MKKILFSLAITSALFVACNTTPAPSTATVSQDSLALTSSSIAYIEMDSLVVSYDMYNDLRAMYELKVRSSENALNQAGAKLEKDIAEYQDKVQKGLVTRATATTMGEQLAARQQEFLAQRDNSLAELQQEEIGLLMQIQESIRIYLKDFNKDKRYSMIFASTASTPVLNADQSLNITKQVCEGLNMIYRAENKKK